MSLLFPCAAQRITGAALIRLYYKPVSGKKKVSFAKFGKFTINPSRRAQREGYDREQREEHARPKVPQRAKEPRAERKVKKRAEQRRKDHIEPQLAPADAHRKEEDEQRKDDAVQRVERAREERALAPPQAHGAQQIVEQREGKAEQQGGGKALCLRRERKAHLSAPEQAREKAAA